MFIRVTTTPNSPRKSVKICENYRKDGKVKQKIVHHVGIALDEVEEEKLKAYAKELIAKIMVKREQEAAQLSLMPLTEQEALNYQNHKVGRPKRKALKDILPPSQVTLDDIIEEKRIIDGIPEVAGAMFNEIYGNIFSQKKKIKILRDIILARLSYPSSKHKSQQQLEKRFGIEHSLDAIYRVMDYLFNHIDDIKKVTFNKTQALFPEKIDLLLFDVTTLYFESTNIDELRNFGYSKDHRFNTSQVVLALATNQDGLPIGYELFEGNKAEVSTLIAAIESWKKLFCIDSICFVGDRAMFTADNIQLLEKNKYNYIVAAKLKKLPIFIQEKIFQEDNYRMRVLGNNLAWIAEFPHAIYSCNLLHLMDVPTKSEIKNLLQNNLYGYALIQDNFYFVNNIKQSCVSLELSSEIVEQLKGLLKIKTSKQIFASSKIIRKKISEQNLEDIYNLTGHSLPSKLVVSYKSKRAVKDLKDRERIIQKIKKKIGNGNPNNLITNNGVKQFTTTDQNSHISLDQDKINKATQWDGLHGIITNLTADSAESLLARYSKLLVIEESFRVNKHNLQMRPIFHWKAERIHAHIAICYMTFAVLRHLQYRINLTQKVSIDTILDELAHTQSSIYMHKKTKDRYKVPGHFSNNARKIYKAFDIERSLDASVYLPQ